MEKQRVNMDLDKDLWKSMSIRCTELDMEKKQFVENAIREEMKRGQKKN